MDKRNERAAMLAGLLAAVWLVVDFALMRVTHLRVLSALLPYPVFTPVICVTVFFRERLARRTEEEKRDAALAARERASGSIFEDGTELYSIGRGREQVERFIVPAIAPLLAAGLGWCVWSLLRSFKNPVTAPEQRLLAMAFLLGGSFLLFLLSRYLLGLSREVRLLRGPGVALGVTCLASLVAAVATLAVELGLPAADRIAALLLTALLGVLAVESFVNFIAELYRPKRTGDEVCRSYESRLGGLLTEPGRWARTAAGTLDYQFGFKVSETWLFRFLENALLPLIIFQLVALYLLSCLVFLGPNEEGILERFGKPVAQLDSGAHLKLPWPFETVLRFPSKHVLAFRIGQGQAGQMEPPVILWSVPHAQAEEQFLTASPRVSGDSVPVNLVAFNIPVEYRITNIYQFAYQHADAPRLVEQIAYRSLTQEAASRDLFDLMGNGQGSTAASLWQRIQAEADRRQLGIQVVFVGLQGVHPPTQVAEAFEAVVGATEQREATIHSARVTATRTTTLAAADGAKAKFEAAGYRSQRTELSAAEAQRFLIQSETARKSPRVFRSSLYLNTLAEALSDTRKYIVPASVSSEVIQFNFEDKLRPELFDLGAPPEPKKE